MLSGIPALFGAGSHFTVAAGFFVYFLDAAAGIVTTEHFAIFLSIRVKDGSLMPTDALERVTLIFNLFDRNGNGHLEAEDFEIMAADVVEAAPESGAAAKDAMRAAFRQYWQTLAEVLDVDRDGEITFDEYTAVVLSPERFDSTIRVFAESLAALGDPDGDGLIERHVFHALMTAIGFERANIEALFDAFGPSASDQITVSTWVAGIKDYYSPSKTGIPGDHLVSGAPTA